MNAKRAFSAGVLGGIVMTILVVVGNLLGMNVSLSMILGTLFGLEPSATAWILGFVVHLVISGLIALAYAAVFERLRRPATASVGVGLSIIHALIGGVVMGFIPMIHWLIPGTLPAPGFFLQNAGPSPLAGIVIFFVLHMIYGAIVGGLYHRVTVPRRREVIMRERTA